MAKFCVNYFTTSSCKDEAECVMLDVYAENLFKLEEYVKNHSDKLIIAVVSGTDWEPTSAMIEKLKNYENIIWRLNDFFIGNINETRQLYPDIRVMPWSACYDWEELYVALEDEVITDIVVCNGLLFDMTAVSKMAKRKNKKIFVLCNAAPYTFAGPAYLSGFVRPEDVKFYEPYADYFIIWGGDATKIDTLYKIYVKDGHFDGKISDLIPDLDLNINGNKLMSNQWAKYRVNCGRECMRGVSCSICRSQLEIAGALEDMGIAIDNK